MMTNFAQNMLVGAIILIACLVGYFSLVNDFSGNLIASLSFLSLFLLFHLIKDKPPSTFFIGVISIFIFSESLRLFSTTSGNFQPIVVYSIELLMIVAILFVLREILAHVKISLSLNRWWILVLIILFINIITILRITQLIDEFSLWMDHMFFGFVFTTIKMLILSVGMIAFLLSSIKSRKVSFLNATLALLFLSDVVDTMNYLYFMDNLVPGVMFLQSGFSMVAIFFFYIYCTYPDRVFK